MLVGWKAVMMDTMKDVLLVVEMVVWTDLM